MRLRAQRDLFLELLEFAGIPLPVQHMRAMPLKIIPYQKQFGILVSGLQAVTFYSEASSANYVVHIGRF
jgi:hypothetical protein